MRKIKLTKRGLVCFRFDDELRDKHDFKRKDGKTLVFSKETGHLIRICESLDEANLEYWRLDKDHYWLTSLRDYFDEIEEGVTLQDFVSFLEADEFLNGFISRIYGEDWSTRYEDCEYGVSIHRECHIEDGYLTFYNYCDMADEGFIVSNTMTLDNEEVDYQISLFEIIDALFADVSEAPRKILITKDGAIENGEKVDDPLLSWRSIVELDDDVTIADVFKFVDSCELFRHVMGAYSWCRWIEQFHVEATLPDSAADLGEKSNLTRCAVSRNLEINSTKGYGDWLDDNVDFTGWMPCSEETKEYYRPSYLIHYDTKKTTQNIKSFDVLSEEIALEKFEEWKSKIGLKNTYNVKVTYKEAAAHPEEERCGLSFSPVYHYARKPLVFDDSIILSYGFRHKKEGVVFEGKHKMPLYEFLDAIYWDISFYGGPEVRDDTLFDLKGRVEEIDALPENPDERESAGFIDIDDIKKIIEED